MAVSSVPFSPLGAFWASGAVSVPSDDFNASLTGAGVRARAFSSGVMGGPRGTNFGPDVAVSDTVTLAP